jgi:cytochrome c2
MSRAALFAAAFATAAVSLAGAPALAQPNGAELFALQCKFCHDDDSLGPNLTGVADRKMGSTSFDYSAALKAKGEAGATWTDAELDHFLKAPAEHTPGTKMMMSVAADPDRAAIIAYLKTLK